MKKIIIATAVLALFATWAFAASDPMSAVKTPLDKALSILNDPQYKDGAKEAEQRDRLWVCIEEVFDFVEVGKRALARNWRKFTPAERKEFCDVFAQVMGNAYLSRIQTGFEGEKIVYLDTVPDKRPEKSSVRTKIVSPNREIPVDYQLLLKKGSWRVYDVKIEGVSLVQNYRSQFNKLLMNQKPAELISRLKTKLEKQETSEDI